MISASLGALAWLTAAAGRSPLSPVASDALQNSGIRLASSKSDACRITICRG